MPSTTTTTTKSITPYHPSTSPPVQYAGLFAPPPKSMTLHAALFLLESPLIAHNPCTSDNNVVFLLSRQYLQTWLTWAYHEPVDQDETDRVKKALKLVCDQLGFTSSSSSDNKNNTFRLEDEERREPGPIDSTDLSASEEDPLLLRDHLTVGSQASIQKAMMMNGEMNSTTSGSISSSTNNNNNTPSNGKTKRMGCCAVPEKFYELLRSVHGVLCEDRHSISFQPFDSADNAIMYHHPMKNDGNNNSNTPSTNGYARPMEFRRRVLLMSHQQQRNHRHHHHRHSSKKKKDETISPVVKLMQEANADKPKVYPVVEVYPVKCFYTIDTTTTNDDDDDDDQNNNKGFMLVSKSTPVLEALQAIMKTAAPEKSHGCVRVWVKRQTKRKDSKFTNGSAVGNVMKGYELVRLNELDGKLRNKEGKLGTGTKKDSSSEAAPPPVPLSMGEWTLRQNGPGNLKSIDLRIETRQTGSTPWKWQEYELEHRIKVGDFCDAQDVTGTWYEAIVRKVEEDTVTVHYMGWASRWDTQMRRWCEEKEVVGVKQTINPPAPLWTHSKRWRETIKEGQRVEVRESKSKAMKPKWLRGRIRYIARANAKLKPMDGGAELEAHEDALSSENGKKVPLVLLNRTQQVLVEVDKEKSPAGTPLVRSLDTDDDDEEDDAPLANPPSLRWVSLFGEEICMLGTHLKVEEDTGPATVSYTFDPRKGPVEVSKTFQGAGFVRESLRGRPPAPGAVGLHNLGNSCFLNSVVQCLNHMDPMTQYFLDGAFEKDLNADNPLGSGGVVANAYASFLKQVWSGEYSAIAPRLLKQTVATFAPQFNNLYQHDSHEFCSFLMDGIHEDCNRVKSKPYVEDFEGAGMADENIAIESWRRHLLRHDSIIVDYCQGMHRSHVTCPLCGRESIKFDVYSSISLPIAPKKDRSAIPLSDCLEKFTEGEQLDEHNAWYCPKCREHVCALKMLALWSVPDILIFHLKRFTYETRSGGVVRNKIEDKVVFPIEGLDMTDYILGPKDPDAPPIYKLFGVSEHSGPTANSGHYTATVRNSKNGEWYRYNDSNVGQTSGEAGITGGAYLLFYKRVKGCARWAGMEKIMTDGQINPRGALESDQDGFVQVKPKKNKKSK